MGIFEWEPLLERWSDGRPEALAAREPESLQVLDEDIVRHRRLGFASADSSRTTALDERVLALGMEQPLPPSLRSFLETANGRRDAGRLRPPARGGGKHRAVRRCSSPACGDGPCSWRSTRT
ncbi:hypothetical protein GCM10010254_62710 [Streptomyces chromofuscus]|nr:hypothetical protein GCM10010254_62710 [Streptomyces chromofuscus]